MIRRKQAHGAHKEEGRSLLKMMRCWLFLSLYFSISTAAAQPQDREVPSFSRIDVLKGEASLTHEIHAVNPLKERGEEVGRFDLSEVQLLLNATPFFPSAGEATVRFSSMVDGLTEVPLYLLYLTESDFEVFVSIDEDDFIPAPSRFRFDGTLTVQLPRALNIGEEARIRFDFTRVTWEEEEPPSVVEDREMRLTHILSSKYIPFNGETALYDFFTLETIIEAGPDVSPGGLGTLVSRPAIGREGAWYYRSEISAQFFVYSVGGEYPDTIDDLIEVSAPLEFPLSEGTRALGEAARDVVDFYEMLYGPFPFTRLGIWPISEQAGAAIGPQAQVLVPWYFWSDELDFGPTFDRDGVLYHEIAHQYFFNTVRIEPDPLLKGHAWLSEAVAEYSALRALEALKGEGELSRSVNFSVYLLDAAFTDHPPVASHEINEDFSYFSVVYMRGSLLIYALWHRMLDFDEVFRECVISWRALFITSDDMYGCFASMTPKEPYRNFDLEEYWSRYFESDLIDEIFVRASYLSDEESLLYVRDQEVWEDRIEVITFSPEGQESALYFPRGVENAQSYLQSAARVDPHLTTPRLVLNLNSADVDLNGLVDGQDALDVLFYLGRDLEALEDYFPHWADVDGDGRISERDLTEVVTQIGTYF